MKKLLIGVALAFSSVVMANDWPQWRGPEQTGVSRETGLPSSWDPETGENLVWRNKIAGMSSPIVMKGRVYAWTRVGEQESGDGDHKTIVVGPKTQEALVCCDAETGKTLWEYRVNMFQTDVPFHRLGWGNVVGDPRTGRVYGYGVQGMLVCLDENGKLVWQHQMLEEYGMISTFGGRTQSPAIDEDQVFLTGVAFGWADHAQGQHRIFAFDKNTGALRWTAATGGRPVDAPYNTPVVAVVNGVRIVCFGAGDGGLHGFQARTGRKVFGYKLSKRGINASVMVVGNKLIGCSSEESEDNATMGRVVCLDLANIDQGNLTPRELWRIDGMEAGFASPTTDGKIVYVMDNSGRVHAVELESGKVQWKQAVGTIGKASLVYGDGKLYAAEANGKFSILQPPTSGKKPKVLSKVELGSDAQQLGREYFIFGSPAVSNGRLYLQTAAGTFCIGAKDAPTADVAVPEMKEEPAAKDAAVAVVQVVPAAIVLRGGDTTKFTVRTFDAQGRLIGQNAQAEWSVGQLAIPASPTAPPGTAPTPAGNLKGTVKDGDYQSQALPAPQGGAVVATVKVGDKALTGVARVRVMPHLPWSNDFEQAPANRPPLTWVNAGGKFKVVELEENGKPNKVLVKTLDLDLYHVARTYFGDSRLKNYTIEADIKVGHKMAGGMRQMPDAGVIAGRYTLVLFGNHQQCMINAWSGALPKEEQAGAGLYTSVRYAWEPDKWYHFKLSVTHSDQGAQVRGKVWPRGSAEPEKWTVELLDPMPNVEGSPGLFGESLVTPNKSEIYYDNVVVKEDKDK